eukprot:g4071.t1
MGALSIVYSPVLRPVGRPRSKVAIAPLALRCGDRGWAQLIVWSTLGFACIAGAAGAVVGGAGGVAPANELAAASGAPPITAGVQLPPWAAQQGGQRPFSGIASSVRNKLATARPRQAADARPNGVSVLALGSKEGDHRRLAATCSGRVTLAATAAEQTFTDGSGAAANYASRVTCEWLITAPMSAKVRLRFLRFDTEGCCDKVWIYDGDNTGATKLVNTASGSTAPPAVLSSGASLLVRFTSDGSVESTGFEAVFSDSSCLPGTHSSTGYEPCSGNACPLGRFGPTGSVGASAATCTPCNAGRYSGSAVGAGACQECPSGKWSAATAGSCIACEVGRASNATGATSDATCTTCEAGRFSGDSVGAGACQECPLGKWSAAGAGSCTACAVGRASNATGATSEATCTACAAGTYSAASDQLAVVTSMALSSVYQTELASKCNDGILDNMCHSLCNEMPWLRMDLGESQQVLHIKIWNRIDRGQQHRFGAHVIEVGNGAAGPWTVCFTGTLPATYGPHTEECVGWGRYVRLRMTHIDCLNLAEVQVFSSVGAGACQECPLGKWSAAGADHCTSCEAGRAGNATSATSAAACIACEAGRYSSVGSQCQECWSGRRVRSDDDWSQSNNNGGTEVPTLADLFAFSFSSTVGSIISSVYVLVLAKVLKWLFYAYKAYCIKKAIVAIGYKTCKAAIKTWLYATTRLNALQWSICCIYPCQYMAMRRLRLRFWRRVGRKRMCPNALKWMCPDCNDQTRKRNFYPRYWEPEPAHAAALAALLDTMLDDLEDTQPGLFTQISTCSKAIAAASAQQHIIWPVLKQAKAAYKLLGSLAGPSDTNETDAISNAVEAEQLGADSNFAALADADAADADAAGAAVDDAMRAAGAAAKQPRYQLDATVYSVEAGAAAAADVRVIVSVAGGKEHALRPGGSQAAPVPGAGLTDKATLRLSDPAEVLTVRVESAGSGGAGVGEVQLKTLTLGEESRACVAVHGTGGKHEAARVQLGLTLCKIGAAEMVGGAVKAAALSEVRGAVKSAASELGAAATDAALADANATELAVVDGAMRAGAAVTAERKAQNEEGNRGDNKKAHEREAQMQQAPTMKSNRQCADHTVCTSEQHEVKAAGTHANRICKDNRHCTVSEYETRAPGVLYDWQCKSISQSPDTHYKTAAPTKAIDRTCVALAVCKSGSQFGAVAVTRKSDRACQDCQDHTQCTARSGIPSSGDAMRCELFVAG